jgi:hypothetical protein
VETIVQEALAILKRKVRTADGIDDCDYKLAIEEAEQAILNYCNIDTVPLALKFTLANMAADVLKFTLATTISEVENSSETIPDVDVSQISSITIGDVKLDLGGNKSNETYVATKAHTLDLDSLTMNYKAQLNKYRRMTW